MNIIAVDDERLALKSIIDILINLKEHPEVKGFQSASEAIEFAKSNKVDVAFLDVEMASINGIELAKKMKDINPSVNIIFMTGYSEYAVDAMGLRASGYLLKPANEEMVQRELDNLRFPINPSLHNEIFMHTFGSFEIFINGKPVTFNWGKSKELLAFLVDKKGAGTTTAEIATVLYPDKEYNRSLKNQIQNVIIHMMKPLKEADAEKIIIKKWNYLAVDTTRFKCDYYGFLEGDVNSINSFLGEYMKEYSWAEFTTGALTQMKNK